jgi:hypothetical protein
VSRINGTGNLVKLSSFLNTSDNEERATFTEDDDYTSESFPIKTG